MEIKTLQNFLEVAREKNMSRAAERLHVSQSTLSKQFKALENELGKKLFIRHSFSIELTEEGMLLRRRSEDLLSMANKITREFSAIHFTILGGLQQLLVQLLDLRRRYIIPDRKDQWRN